MATKKNKSTIEDEAVANLSTGWRKSKMSQAAVQELENMGLLQTLLENLSLVPVGKPVQTGGSRPVLMRDFLAVLCRHAACFSVVCFTLIVW